MAKPGADGIFDVRAFGAKGDGRTLDSVAINKAISAAHAAGGGTVRFSAGTYVSVTIELKSNVGLYLAHGAVIEAATPNVATSITYLEPEPVTLPGNTYDYQDFGHTHFRNSLIWGENVQNISITGPGLIDGKGLVRGGSASSTPTGAGNKAIALKNCRHVILRDFSILRGGWFGILATGVDDLTIDNLKIDTVRDGIDIDCCRYVRISNCHVNSPNDDGICLKSSYGLGLLRATENVNITNCMVSGYDAGTFLDGTFKRTVRPPREGERPRGPNATGRIKFGTESQGGFKNITISNCIFEYCRGLALESVDGATMEDVTINNITMRDITNAPIFVRLGSRLRPPKDRPVGTARRIIISNITAFNVWPSQGILISGIPDHPIEDLQLSNIRIHYQGGGTAEQAAREVPENETAYPEPSNFGPLPAYGLFARHVKRFKVRDVEVSYENDDQRPGIVLDDVQDAMFDNVKAQHAEGVHTFSMSKIKEIMIHNCPGLRDLRIESIDKQAY